MVTRSGMPQPGDPDYNVLLHGQSNPEMGTVNDRGVGQRGPWTPPVPDSAPQGQSDYPFPTPGPAWVPNGGRPIVDPTAQAAQDFGLGEALAGQIVQNAIATARAQQGADLVAGAVGEVNAYMAQAGQSGGPARMGSGAPAVDPLEQMRTLYGDQLEDRLKSIKQQYKPLFNRLRKSTKAGRREIRQAGRQARQGMAQTEDQLAAQIDMIQQESAARIQQLLPEGDAGDGQASEIAALYEQRAAQAAQMAAENAAQRAGTSRLIQQASRSDLVNRRQDIAASLRSQRAAARGAARDAYNEAMIQLEASKIAGAGRSGGGGGGGGGGYRSSSPQDDWSERLQYAEVLRADPNSPYYGMNPATIAAASMSGFGGIQALIPEEPDLGYDPAQAALGAYFLNQPGAEMPEGIPWDWILDSVRSGALTMDQAITMTGGDPYLEPGTQAAAQAEAAAGWATGLFGGSTPSSSSVADWVESQRRG